jgi:ferredoxin
MAFVCQPAAPRKTEVCTSNREASEAHRAHICGPTPMMDAVKAVLLDLGVPGGQIRTEAFGTDRRDPTRRTGKSGKFVGKVRFLDTGKTSTSWDGATLLDVADEAKVRIDSACRFGTYGTCRVKLKNGEVRMPVQDALSDADREDGYILACQAEPEGDVALEA